MQCSPRQRLGQQTDRNRTAAFPLGSRRHQGGRVASASVLPRLVPAVSEIDVQVVEDAQYLEGVGLRRRGDQGNGHRAWQGHPVASWKAQIQIVNPSEVG